MVSKEDHGLQIDLWKTYEACIRRLCEYKLKSSPDDIEDVVSETFLYLCEAIENEVKIENYGGWLCAVANNLIKQIYNKNTESKEILVNFRDGTEEYYNIKLGYDIDNELVSDEKIEEYRELIMNSLSTSEQIIMTMFYEEKRNLKEIGDVLGISENAAKQKHYRTVRKIKKIIKELLGYN